MNRKQSPTKKDNFDCLIPYSRNLLLAIICGLGVILVLTALVFYELGQNRCRSEGIISKEEGEAIPEIPSEIYGISGEIVGTQNNALIIKTKDGEEWRVTVDENTAFSTIDYTKSPEELAVNEIALSDLKKGDKVSASSLEDVKDKKTFQAVSISRKVGEPEVKAEEESPVPEVPSVPLEAPSL